MTDSSGSNKPTVVLIHGLFGSPQEFEPLQAALTAEGYPSRTLTLLGHAERRQASGLSQIQAQQLLDDAMGQWQALTSNEPCILLGHSLGGVVATWLACQKQTQQQAEAVVTIGSPYQEGYILKPWRWLKPPHPLQSSRYIKDYWHGLPKPVMHPWHWPHLRQQGYTLLHKLQQAVPQLPCPIQLYHSRYDLSVPYEELERWQQALQTHGKAFETQTLSECGHQIYPKSRYCEAMTQQLLEALAKDFGF